MEPKLSWVRWIQSTPLNTTYFEIQFNIFIPPMLDLQKWHFPSEFSG